MEILPYLYMETYTSYKIRLAPVGKCTCMNPTESTPVPGSFVAGGTRRKENKESIERHLNAGNLFLHLTCQ